MLSKKAQSFINCFSKNRTELSESKIRNTFLLNNIEPSSELIEFEKKYSGLCIPIGFEQITFGLIYGGVYPFNPNVAIIETYFSDATNDYLLVCSKTKCQLEYALDNKGRFYEDEKLKFNSFEEFIENIIE